MADMTLRHFFSWSVTITCSFFQIVTDYSFVLMFTGGCDGGMTQVVWWHSTEKGLGTTEPGQRSLIANERCCNTF